MGSNKSAPREASASEALFVASRARELFIFETLCVILWALLEIGYSVSGLYDHWNWSPITCIGLRLVLLVFRFLSGRVVDVGWATSLLAGFLDLLVFVQSFEPIVRIFLVVYAILFAFPMSKSLVFSPLVFACSIGTLWWWYRNNEEYAADDGKGFLKVEAYLTNVAIMGFAMINLALGTRWFMDRSRWKAFALLEEQTRRTIEEKVLRCQAEFKVEMARSGAIHTAAADTTSGSCESRLDVDPELGDLRRLAANPCRPLVATAPSHCSAPAVIAGRVPGEVDPEPELGASSCGNGDCLPHDALVWLEGEALPKPVGQVLPGQRVLCFDRLGGHLKHATVMETSTREGRAAWTKVVLADGTTIKMTADHPVQPAATTIGHGSLPPMPSAQLRPGLDKLLVLKVVPTEVQTVQVSHEDCLRTYLTVQQPGRHTVFVSSVGDRCAGMVQPVAVESADALAHPATRLQYERTFVTFSEERRTGDGSVHTQPCKSAPPSLHGCATPRVVGLPAAVPHESSDCSSLPSSGKSDVHVVLGGPLQAKWMPQGDGSFVAGARDAASRSQAQLSDLIGVKASGAPSLGSFCHGDHCTVCIFENYQQHHGEKGCFKGALCERCHHHHGIDMKAVKVHQKSMRSKKRNEQRRVLTNGYPCATQSGG